MLVVLIIFLGAIVLNSINSYRNYSIAEKNKAKRLQEVYSD
ncbi:hypothetical protein BH10BAC2_BH10BAC2_24200 [soil metagenome]